MKKFIAIAITVCMMLAFTACMQEAKKEKMPKEEMKKESMEKDEIVDDSMQKEEKDEMTGETCMCGDGSRCMAEEACKDGCMCMKDSMCTDKCMCAEENCIKDGACTDKCMCEKKEMAEEQSVESGETKEKMKESVLPAEAACGASVIDIALSSGCCG